MKNLPGLVLILAFIFFGCGDNIENPPATVVLSPPQTLTAVSLSSTSVRIQWSPPATGVDSAFLGYLVTVGTRVDTLSRAQLSYMKDSLSTGAVTFSVAAFKQGGTRSANANITWAAAARFDSTYVMHEKNAVISQYFDGFHVGSASTNPFTMLSDPADPQVQQLLHFFLNGGTQQIQQPLAFWSAHLLVGSFNHTLFSTQVDSAASLDFPLGAFPGDETFTKDTIQIANNRIYYARIVGDPDQVNYARIHVRFVVGSAFPDRLIEVRISLQRAPGLLFADMPPFSCPRRTDCTVVPVCVVPFHS
jgi:hypothetical protein